MIKDYKEKDPYIICPIFDTKSFLIRLITEEDANDLFECYNDLSAVSLMNADNCDFGFYMETLEHMKETIKYWLNFYQKRGFIRFSIVDKLTNKVVGTIEGFDGEIGVLRVDLNSKNEHYNSLVEIIELCAKEFKKIFSNKVLVTKAIPSAKERRKALENNGWTYIKNYKDYFDYYMIRLVNE